MYEIHIERRAVKELEKITSEEQEYILQKISAILSSYPFPTANNPKRLKGNYAFRLRISNYSVIYTIENNKVLVYAIAKMHLDNM